MVEARFEAWYNIARISFLVTTVFGGLSTLAYFNILGSTISRLIILVLMVIVFVLVNAIPILFMVFLGKFALRAYDTSRDFIRELQAQTERLNQQEEGI